MNLYAYIGLLHPLPSGATVLVALAFALLFAPRLPGRTLRDAMENRRRLWRLGAMMAAQQGAISLHNDWCDRHLDATAKPWRAIPRGLVPAPIVHGAAWALGALSTVPAWPIGARLVALDAIGIGAGFLYNARLKRTPWSWLPFATAFPLLPLFGATAVGVWPRLWWSLFVVGAPTVLAIHLADTIPDLEGDAGSGVQGIAHRLGAPQARRVCLGALAAASLLGAAFGLLGRARPALAGAAAGAGLAALAALKPKLQRGAVTAGAAAVAVGWVAALARRP